MNNVLCLRIFSTQAPLFNAPFLLQKISENHKILESRVYKNIHKQTQKLIKNT